jgi:hypothetical protein
MQCYSHLPWLAPEVRNAIMRELAPFDRGDRPSDRPSEVDGLARALPQQAAERALLAASRRRSLSIAQAA